MLKLSGLRAGYNGTEALHGISLEIEAGTIVSVVGANGAGKSTLINTISRLVSITSGAISFDGQPLAKLSAPQAVDLGIVQVPEGRQVFGALTVAENLKLGFYRLRRRRDPAIFRERLDYVYDLFPKLNERAGQRAITLSGGEQSMVAIGRALMADPRLLLLDEPSLGLAPLVVERMFEVLRTLRQSGLTILLVEQHADEALALSDYGYVLSVGSIVAHGTGQSLRKHPTIREAYLGSAELS
ncbi:MAG: ABC transporter ATP-binding protein [Paraburkholderia sp.]|uniref:ABC transporter ATP-binding protein n=1 Tax=Paraburkholderia sp. TaxID=1926495 RepID=UPI003C50F55E